MSGRHPDRARDRRIVRLAAPALGTLAVEPLYVLVDTAIVGRLGTVPLAGLAVAATVLTTLITVCNFLAYGTTARVAFLCGQGDRRGGATPPKGFGWQPQSGFHWSQRWGSAAGGWPDWWVAKVLSSRPPPPTFASVP